MAGGEVLGHGRIIVEVEENVRAELAKAEAAFDRTMAKLDRKEASLTLNADTSKFYEKVRKAQADLEKWNNAKADATLGVDSKQANAGIANAKRRLADYEKANTATFHKIQQLDADRTAAAERLDNQRLASAKKIDKAIERQAKVTAKAIADAEKAATDEAIKQANRRATEGKKVRDKQVADEVKGVQQGVAANVAAEKERQRQFEATAKAIALAEKKATDERIKEQNRAAAEGLRARKKQIADETRSIQQAGKEARKISLARNNQELADLENHAKLQRRFIDLQEKQAKLTKTRNNVFLPHSERVKVDLDLTTTTLEIEKLKARLAAIGKPPPEVDIHVNDRGSAALSKWASALTDTTVRLGPFTSTIGGAVRALALLGPVIVGVIGATGALAGALGAGVAGGIGIGAAALAGFIPLLAGTVFAVKPIVSEFMAASKAQKKYNDAVMKYGEGSKQAVAANKQLKSVLATLPAGTKEAIAGYQKLKDTWKDRTGDVARNNVAAVIGQGIKSATKLLPMFSAQTNKFMTTASGGIQNIFKGLSSSGGQKVLGNIFGNVNAALGPILAGLTSLGAAAGKVLSAFSNALPGLAKDFANWAKGINDAASNTGKVQNVVDTLVKGFRATIHVIGAATDLLAKFFFVGAGTGGGIQFLDDIASGLDRITASIQPGAGGGLANFFKDSINTTKDLFGVLSPIVQLFMEWATIMRPFTTIFLQIGGAVSSLVNTLAGFGPTRALLLGAFTLFIGGTLVGKVLDVVGAMRTLAVTMRAVGTAGVGLRALDVLSGGLAGRGKGGQFAAEAGQLALFGKSAKTAGKEVGIFRAAAQLAVPPIVGMGAVAGGAATLGLGLLAAAAVYGGYKLLTMKSETEKFNAVLKQSAGQIQTYQGVTQALANTFPQLGASQRDYAHSVNSVAAAKKELQRLDDAGLKNTPRYLAQLDALNQKLLERQRNEGNAAKFAIQNAGLAAKQIAMDKGRATAQDALNKALGEQAKYQKQYDSAKAAKDSQGEFDAKKRLAGASKEVTAAQKQLNAATNAQKAAQAQALVNTLNYQRSLQGLIPLSDRAAASLAALSKAAPKTALKIATKFADPKDAGRVAQSASAAIKAGTSKAVVVRIVADSKNATDAIRRLSAAKITPKRLSIVEQGGSSALKMVQQLIGKKIPKKDVAIIEKGGSAALKKLAQLLGIKLPKKTQNVGEQGSGKVMAALAKILGIKLPNKSFTVRAIDQATSVVAGVQRYLNGLQNKSITVSVRRQNIGPLAAGARGTTPGGNAPLASQSKMAQAYTSAQSRRAEISRGGKYAQPTLLVGEERRSEFVVATNPAYRKRNKGILASAANAFGMQLTTPDGPIRAAAAGGISNINVSTGYTPTSTIGKAPASPGKKPPTIKRGSTKFGDKKRKAYKSGRAWVSHIMGLQTQQSDWEREISIRESQVNEPTELLVETGRIKDPNTGEDLGPQMAVNQPAIDSYVGQLQAVQQAMDMLVNILMALITDIPKALTAIKYEDMFRQANQKNLKASIHREETVIANHEAGTGKGGKVTKNDKEVVSRWKKMLQADKDRLDHETEQRKVIKEDKVTLNDGLKEAGFDIREAKIARQGVIEDKQGIQGKATAAADQSNADTLASAAKPDTSSTDTGGSSDTSTSGTADTGPTLAQQTGMADTERANILRQFGGNTGAPVTSGLAGRGGGGVQTNISSAGSFGTAGSVMNAGVAAMGALGASGAISALAGGATAASMMGAAAGRSLAGVSGSGGAVLGAGSSSSVNIVNNFAAPPPDPHSWTQGVKFEAGSVL